MWRFRGAPFSLMDFCMERQHLISACRSPQLSVSFLVRTFRQCRWGFFCFCFCFFPQGLHLVVKVDSLVVVFFFFFKDIITNAHQLTGTRLDLFINSLWFNSLTLLPCYANSCGQSMTPSRWGFGQIIFCLTTPLTDVEWRFAFKRASFLAFVFCFCFFRWVYSSIETGIKRTCQL